MKPYIEIYYRALDMYGSGERVRIPRDDLCEWLQRKTEFARKLGREFTIISVHCVDYPK